MDHAAWRQLTRDQHEQELDRVDELALQTTGIDAFCSSSFWTLPALDAFHPDCPAYFLHHPLGVATFAAHDSPFLGRLLMPLEATWCLASPLVASQTLAVATLFADYMQAKSWWDSLYLSGLVENSPLWHCLVNAFAGNSCFRAYPSVRCHASLAGGSDGYLSRRSPRFRKRLRQAQRKLREHRFRCEWQAAFDAEAVESFFEQAMALEALSWKGQAGEGVDQGSMFQFYQAMLPRLAARGCLRTVTLWDEAQLVGYAFGGVWGSVFRGLQFSYLPQWQQLSLGNLMQWELITHLCDEGLETYDLGMDMDYKRRWSEALMTTHALLIRR